MNPRGTTPEDAAETMLASLQSAGLKLTTQRMAIVRQLAGDRSHPTAQELFERLRPEFPAMSFATVYNTLDTLSRCGLTGSLRLGGAVRFDPNVAPHHHAVCDSCGAVTDLPTETEGPREQRVLEGGFRVRAEERIYRGLCGRCIDT